MFDNDIIEPEPVENKPAKEMLAEKAFNYFKKSKTSLDSVLSILETSKNEHECLPELLETFKNIKQEYPLDLREKKHPLIVLEGLDGSGKSTVSKRLAKSLNAEQLSTPPKSMSSFREKFDGHKFLHTPFYYFGNYVAAVDVAKILKEKPVVMDRFWHSTTAYALAQMKEDYSSILGDIAELPPEHDEFYKWPSDLLKPDVVLFLDVSEDVRNERLSRRKTKTDQEKLLSSKQDFRKNVIVAYDNIESPSIQKVNGDKTFADVLGEIHEKIKHLF